MSARVNGRLFKGSVHMQPEHHRNSTPSPSSVPECTTGSSEEAVPKRRLGGRSAKVQVAVFNATIELLLTEGYDAVTIAEVASRSGIHETSIYRRWKTKEALVSEVLIQRAKEVLPMPDTGSVQSDLVQLLHSVIAFLQSPMGKAMIQVGAALLHVSAMIPEHQHYW